MRRKHIGLPDHARRNFLQWSIGLGATLGLRPWKVFEVNESIVGPALAAEGACAPVTRYVGTIMGNGGFAWMTQLYPFQDQATQAGRSFYATGQATNQLVENGDHPMMLGPHAPTLGGRKVTAFMAGNNETHTAAPRSVFNVATGVSLLAAVSSMQTAASALVPAIAVGNVPFGTAPGAPQLASVTDPTGMVELFNSQASAAGGALANSNDASMFEAFYKANLELRRAAQLPTSLRSFRTGKVGSNLLGKNLANQLRPTQADLTRYGIDRNTPNKLASIANTLITTVKSFKMNLTNSVFLPAMNDDPHDAFNNMATLQSTVVSLGNIFNAFYADLDAEDDPLCPGSKIGHNTVMTISGDTPKNPFQPGGWPDGTPGNSNWVYVISSGRLRGGWFGHLSSNGQVQTWNPTTGQNVAGGNVGALAGPAGAAILYAVSKSDMRRVQDFYRGQAITGVVVPNLT